MSLLVENLARFCREHPLEEKILVVPTHLVGQEIVSSVAAGGQPVFNLRVETVASLAAEIMAEELAREGVRVLSRAEEMAIVEDACSGARAYFGAIREHPGFHQAAALTIRELAEAGLDPAAVSLPGNERKQRDLAGIAARYRENLERHRLLDRAGLLRRALESAKPSGAFLLIPAHPQLAADERRLIESLSGARCVEIPTDGSEDWRSRARGFLLARCASPEEEVRRAVRRLASEGASLDQAELVYVRADALPVIFELLKELGMPATFAEGIPLRYTRPGRAALGFLRWIERDFEAETLATLLESGALRVSGAGEAVPGGEAARELRIAGIGWGRERYPHCLAASTPLRGWTEGLLAAARDLDPFGTISPSKLARGLAGLVGSAAAVRDDPDPAGSETLVRLLGDLAGIERPERPAADAFALLREILQATATAASGPRPGCLHVASVSSAGYSSRARTFVVGLDADHFPGRVREDPLLSDREREALNAGRAAGLRLRGERVRQRREDFEAMLSRLRGEVEISYPSRDPAEDTETFPSPFLLELLRECEGEQTLDYEALGRALGARTQAENPPAPLTESEWWLDQVRTGKLGPAIVSAQAGAVLPVLGNGLAAQARRRELAFTEFDGAIASSPERFDPRRGRRISPSSIETFARCPYLWFLREELKLAPPAVLERDEEVWLDERSFGSAVHEVLHDFLAELGGRRPSPGDSAGLMALAKELLDARRRGSPPAAEGPVQRDRRRMERLCAEFLRLEAMLPAGQRVQDVELGLSEPVPVSVGEGASFPLTGRIDRVDTAPEGSVVVYDYKTGRRPVRAEKEGFASGRRIQPALYALALQTRDGVSRKVTSACYYHLAPGAGGFVETFEGSRRGELLAILNALFDAMASGAFIHSRDPNRCQGCEFAAVCGRERATRRAAGLLDRSSPEGNPLAPFHRLKGWVRVRSKP